MYIYPLNIAGNTTYGCYSDSFNNYFLTIVEKPIILLLKLTVIHYITYRKPLLAHFQVQNINVSQ